MRVVILNSGRGTLNDVVDKWRNDLSLEAEDVLSLISWHPAAEPLHVSRHLVLGPIVHATDGHWQVVSSTPSWEAELTADRDEPDESTGLVESAGLDEAAGLAESDDIDESAPLEESDDDEVPEPVVDTADPATTAQSPVRCVLKKARRIAGTVKWSTLRMMKTFPRKVKRKVRALMRFNTQYAVMAARSARAMELCRDADVVISLDARSQQAAWVLAQRVSEPYVVAGLAAANRVISGIRAGQLTRRPLSQ